MRTNLKLMAFAMLAIPVFASADVLFAVDNTTSPGLQGYLTYDKFLNFTGAFATNTGTINGIAAGSTNDVFLTDAHNVYHFDAHGNQLGVYNGFSGDGFGRASYHNGILYVADNTRDGIQGIVEFNIGLSDVNTFLTPEVLTGVASNGSGVIGVTKTAFAQYNNVGTNQGGYTGFPDDGFGAADQTGNTVYVADNTDSPGLYGVVAANATTWGITGTFLTPDPINGLAAGSSSDLYLSFDNRVQRVDLNGNVLNTWNGLSGDRMYDLAYATPEPASMVLLGLGAAGLLRRRRSAKA